MVQIGLQQNLSQQLVMTPQLQQAIKLLQLSHLELLNTIQQEIEENPILEETAQEDQEETDDSNNKDKNLTKEDNQIKEITIDESINKDIDWETYINEYNSTGRIYTETNHQQSPNYEAFTSAKKTLKNHLQWQLLMHGQTKEEEAIGSIIIGNLNLNGYLCTSIEEIIDSNSFNQKKVEKVLKIIQSFDPSGVCAKDLKECLLIQIEHLGIKNPFLKKIISNHMKHLENKNYNKIAQSLQTNIKNVIIAVNIIKYLEPKPGRKFNTDEPHYIIPDIYVYKKGDDFKIIMNEDGLPKLKINHFYKNVISNGKQISKGTKTYLNEKIQSASWFIKSIHQRQKTIYSVMESIIKFQKEFFQKGISYLKPMVLRDIAEDIEMHESTISRVTTNKYTYTPQGLFELKYFFNSSIKRLDGDFLSSTSVKDKIKLIIQKEDTKKPYSDRQIANLLKKVNINIARRTIAKYRETLRILPSSKRKQF
ncbi:MAG: RNA polymerase sigma-54 factor [Desulfobacteraceae bacterium 4572_130]|nr:MAG: RNA polymerase sigma-54 factor [Desulfobacteraceae bacterium 4572_130]